MVIKLQLFFLFVAVCLISKIFSQKKVVVFFCIIFCFFFKPSNDFNFLFEIELRMFKLICFKK